MGSDSDLPVMQGAIDVLVEFGVRLRGAGRLRPPHARRHGRVRPHRRRPRPAVIIAGAGGAAHLPGMTASMTPLPVIGVPVAARAARRPRLAAVDRADARGRSGRDGRGRQRPQRGAARGAHPRHERREAARRDGAATRPTSRRQVRDKDAKLRDQYADRTRAATRSRLAVAECRASAARRAGVASRPRRTPSRTRDDRRR